MLKIKRSVEGENFGVCRELLEFYHGCDGGKDEEMQQGRDEGISKSNNVDKKKRKARNGIRRAKVRRFYLRAASSKKKKKKKRRRRKEKRERREKKGGERKGEKRKNTKHCAGKS